MTSRDILTKEPQPADARLYYGSGEHHFGDLRLPHGAGPHPVIIGIHGGFWRAMYGLGYYGHLCEALRQAGLATWNIEYRRLGHIGGGWPGTFDDVAHAVDHLRQLAPTYHLDLARVISLGHSAGGHLALWAAGRHRISPTDPLFMQLPLPLKGAVCLAGVTDLRRAWEMRLGDNVTEALMGGSPAARSSHYSAASPYELLPLGVPQLLAHGTHDEAVPYEIAVRYVTAARDAGDSVELLTFKGAGHFEVVDPGTREWAAVLAALQKMI